MDKVEAEKITVKLDIDGKKAKSGFDYIWKPATGSVFYGMPEPETKVTLHLPHHDERKALLTESLRMNNDACDSYGDSQKRILEVVSKSKKTVQMFPEELTFQGAKEGLLPEVSIKDKEGIVFIFFVLR